MLPKKYRWLENEGAPKMLVVALSLIGTTEKVGKNNNPIIMSWAEEVGIKEIYVGDSMPWCGLAHAVVAKRAGKEYDLFGYGILRAKEWGTVWEKVSVPELGDTVVFARPGGYHVGLYCGEDATHYCVLGGNQGDVINGHRADAYGITWIAKSRLVAARRPKYINRPINVRRIFLTRSGEPVSDNEA